MRNQGKFLIPTLLLAVFPGAWLSRAEPVKIELPPESMAFKPGKDVELVNANCLICHSSEYVVYQPPMGLTFWKGSVDKMRQKFGAPIPEDQVEKVVNYLFETYGDKEAK